MCISWVLQCLITKIKLQSALASTVAGGTYCHITALWILSTLRICAFRTKKTNISCLTGQSLK